MYKDILLSVDLNDDSSWKKALPTAVEYCKAFGSRLHVITVVPDFGLSMVAQYFPADYEERLVKEADAKLHELIEREVSDHVPVQYIVSIGTIYDEIIQAARKIDADLIVMASHRPEVSDYLIGPNATKVVRHCYRSVLVVRN